MRQRQVSRNLQSCIQCFHSVFGKLRMISSVLRLHLKGRPLCNARQANAFRVSFWWRTAVVAYSAAETCSKCDAAHTDSPTLHTRCMIRTKRRVCFTEECSYLIPSLPFSSPFSSFRPSLAFFALLACVCVCVSVSVYSP